MHFAQPPVQLFLEDLDRHNLARFAPATIYLGDLTNWHVSKIKLANMPIYIMPDAKIKAVKRRPHPTISITIPTGLGCTRKRRHILLKRRLKSIHASPASHD
jgi:hypothetical protein